MPRKNGATSRQGQGGGRPVVAARREVIAAFRGTAEFHAWFRGLMEHTRLPITTTIEHGLIALAERSGYDVPPPPR